MSTAAKMGGRPSAHACSKYNAKIPAGIAPIFPVLRPAAETAVFSGRFARCFAEIECQNSRIMAWYLVPAKQCLPQASAASSFAHRELSIWIETWPVEPSPILAVYFL